MNILIASERFYPNIGGVETVTRLLGQAFVRAGHSVSIITREPRAQSNPFPFRVRNRPGPIALLRLYATADLVILQGPALRLGWPMLCRRRPGLMVHHSPLPMNEPRLTAAMRAKLSRCVCHAAISRALATRLPWPINALLPNPYDDATFRLDSAIPKTRDIIFVGRLVPGKGVDVLVEALAFLRGAGAPATATIVGDGREKERMMQVIRARRLGDCINVVGQITGSALARLLNQHRILAVPSVIDEPFGIVALEGIACGCAVVGSDAGGLPEAIGSCGVTFPKGNAQALAARIESLLNSISAISKTQVNATRHLASHRPKAVARAYLNLTISYRGFEMNDSRANSKVRGMNYSEAPHP